MRRIVSLAIAGLLCLPAAILARDNPPVAEQGKPIDVVICLDVSGSMQGLVESAKIKLWDVVNELAKAKLAPQLRVGLYSYGHTTYEPAKGWVRKEVDLGTDLDDIYKKLFALTINGGEEYVARVTREALLEQKWSNDPSALKIIIVAGNEPATQDPKFKLDEVSALAKKSGVLINTIYCGNPDNSEAVGWRDYATLCGGTFASIDHNRRVVQITTPFDKQLVTLGDKLNSTYVAYGKQAKEKADNQKLQDANAAQLGQAAAAGRTVTKASALYRNAAWCAVDRMIEDPNFDITKVPEDELCDELKKLKPDERVAYLKKKAEERKVIQKEIAELNAKRATFIAEETKKSAGETGKQLDVALKKMIREQAAVKGIRIPE
jgi:hypothetical protein